MASKRRLRRRGCEGKHRHNDRAGAMAHLASLWHGMGRRENDLNVYKCQFCKGWHVGRMTRATFVHRRDL